MVPNAIIRQYAVGQQVDAEVAGQDIVLHYALALLNEAGLAIQPKNFRWTDLKGLVPRRLQQDHNRICAIVRERFSLLTNAPRRSTCYSPIRPPYPISPPKD